MAINFMTGDKKGFSVFNSVFQKYRYWYLSLAIASVVAAIVFSSPFFVKPLYKSTLVMFPSATNSVSRILVSTSVDSKYDVLGFGESERIEQMLQVLNGIELFERVGKRYNLKERYGITAVEDQELSSALYKAMRDNINFKRTENGAIKVEVYDTDPVIAADIANYIGALYDTILFDLKRERALAGYRIAEREYGKAKAELHVLEDSLSRVKSVGVAGATVVPIFDKLEWERKQVVGLKAKCDELRIDAFEFIPQKFVVSRAYPAHQKSYPIRWLIVVGTLFSVMFFMTVVVLLAERKRLQ